MEELEYCEEEAIKFILNYLPAEIKADLTHDDIEYILDLVYDFYDEKGYFSEEEDENDEVVVDIVENEMVEYAVNRAAEEGKADKLTEELIIAILDAEYEYNKSIGVFEEEDEE